nr:hypothetical protein CFP56_63447 [Quercus suber]
MELPSGSYASHPSGLNACYPTSLREANGSQGEQDKDKAMFINKEVLDSLSNSKSIHQASTNIDINGKQFETGDIEMEITLADPPENIDLIKSSLHSWKLRARALKEYLGMIAPVLTKRNVLTNVHFKIPMAKGRRGRAAGSSEHFGQSTAISDSCSLGKAIDVLNQLEDLDDDAYFVVSMTLHHEENRVVFMGMPKHKRKNWMKLVAK